MGEDYFIITFSERGTNAIICVNTSMMQRRQNASLITNCCCSTSSPWLHWNRNLTNSSLGGGGLLYKTFSEMGTNSIIRVNTSMMLRCQNDTLITNCCYGTSSPWLYWNLTTSSLGGGGLLYNNLFRAGHQWHHSHQCVNDALITNCCYSTSSLWLYWNLTTSSAP